VASDEGLGYMEFMSYLTEHINKPCGQCAEVLNVKTGDIPEYSNHCVLKGYMPIGINNN
jgi:hypothetical protein